MIEWILVRGEVLPTIFLVAGATMVFFCFIWLFLEYLMAKHNSPAGSIKKQKTKKPGR